MQTIHHLGYAELTEGVQVGLRAAEMFEQESALWDLQRARVRDRRDGNLGSREQAEARRQDAEPRQAARSTQRGLLVLATGSAARRCSEISSGGGARFADRGHLRARRAAVALFGPPLPAWLRTGEAILSRPRLSSEGCQLEPLGAFAGQAPQCGGAPAHTGVPRR